MPSGLFDNQWLRNAFMIPPDVERGGDPTLGRRDKRTSAAYKTTNTSLGGNFAINNPPQFAPYTDIRIPGLGRSDAERNEGMGRYYSEAIDDTGQVVHLTFGTPQFNSLANFFTNFYDSHSALLANTGRANEFFYTLGFIGGFIVSLPAQPFILGISAVTSVLNFLTRSSPSKWYYFKPTMHTYWSSVSTIANELAIDMGLVPRVNIIGSTGDLSGQPSEQARAAINLASRMFPDIFREEGGVDVMALANRAQRIADTQRFRLSEQLKRQVDSVETYVDIVRNYVDTTAVDYSDNPKNTRDYALEYLKSEQGSVAGNDTDSAGIGGTDSITDFGTLEGALKFLGANLREGNQFVTFRVKHTGSVSESFSNTTRESDMAQKLNSRVASSRSAVFNVMGGNFLPGMDGFINSMKSFAAGALDSVHLGGLASLTGSAFVDIPAMWDGSTANFPTASYTIPLHSPYGDPLSRFQNLMIPISMVLAGALPRSAGRSAYTSPHLCQIYHQGRVVSQLAMIDSLTITRGTGNVGWNASNQMLGAEISFSVKDMSSVMHVPIKGAFASPNWVATLGRAAVQGVASIGGESAQAVATAITDPQVWDEQSNFQSYMASMSSLPLSDMYYVGDRLSLNITQRMTAFRTWSSPSYFQSWLGDTLPARVLSAMSGRSDRI